MAAVRDFTVNLYRFLTGLLYNGNKEKKGGPNYYEKEISPCILLAGTLSMSSVAYASEGGQTLGEVTKKPLKPGRQLPQRQKAPGR